MAQLRHVLSLVEEVAGQPPSTLDALEEAARISSAYEAAPPIVQRRFDALAAETTEWASVGAETLIGARNAAGPPRAAARCLAGELSLALRKLGKIVD
jgi:hypothetical protein